VEDNKARKEKGEAELPLKPVPGPDAKEFTLETVLTGADGKEIAKTEVPVSLMDYQFEWLGHNIGISDKIIPPGRPWSTRPANCGCGTSSTG